jgi:probable phosphoglycerate mutase
VSSRRRLYLMRHGQVAYFEAGGRPVRSDEVRLTEEGREQARAAGRVLAGVSFDRVVTSGLRRTVETARLVAPDREPEAWPELRELRSGRLEDIADDDLEEAFTGAFRSSLPLETRFLGGETVGSLLARVGSALERLLADEWNTALAVLHGGVNRAILSHALTGGELFLGGFEQAPGCLNVLDHGPDWIVRAVGYWPPDPIHARGRSTTMEELLAEYLPYRRRDPR